MAINLNIGNTEVIRDLGKIVVGQKKSFTSAGGWMYNQSYSITLSKGIYIVQGFFHASSSAQGEVIIKSSYVVDGLEQMYTGVGYAFNNQALPFTCVVNIPSDITNFVYSLWLHEANVSCAVAFTFVKIA